MGRIKEASWVPMGFLSEDKSHFQDQENKK